jgi:hypothetical protein
MSGQRHYCRHMMILSRLGAVDGPEHQHADGQRHHHLLPDLYPKNITS